MLKEIKIEGLSSLKALKLIAYKAERISLKNLNVLRHLDFDCYQTSSRLQTDLVDSFKSTIEHFQFRNCFLSFNFKSIDKSLSISFTKNDEDCDLDFIYHSYNHINKLNIMNSNSENLLKLLSGKNFPNLKELGFSFCDISTIESKFFNGSFPMIRKLRITSNKYLEKIDHDAFLNLRELKLLEFYQNPIESIDQRTFSELVNLETLYLNETRLKIIDRKMFSNLKKLKTIDTYPSKLIRYF